MQEYRRKEKKIIKYKKMCKLCLYKVYIVNERSGET